jgi:hypothetical protein
LPAAPAVHDIETGRTLNLHEHEALLRRARRGWATCASLRDVYRQHRPMVERSIACQIGPKGRCRNVRYRGVATNDFWLHTRIAALNLRLTRTCHTWTLTPTA